MGSTIGFSVGQLLDMKEAKLLSYHLNMAIGV